MTPATAVSSLAVHTTGESTMFVSEYLLAVHLMAWALTRRQNNCQPMPTDHSWLMNDIVDIVVLEAMLS